MTSALPPAHWAADPTGRHEHRYWDGTDWTDHVADRGAQSIDPVGEPPAATTTDPEPEPMFGDPTPVVAEPASVDGEWQLARAVTPTPPPPPPAAGVGYLPQTGTRGVGAPLYWRWLEGLRTTLVILLAATGVASLLVVVALLNRLSVIDDLERGRFSSDLVSRANDADDLVSSAGAVALLLVVATGVVFIIWQWRCAKNIEVLGRDGAPRGPGWSIAGWLIPFVNFVMPVLIMQDLWRATEPGTRPGTEWRRGGSSVLVWFWWALFLLGNGIARVVDDTDDNTLEELRSTNSTLVGGYVIMAIAAVLAIFVVLKLTRRFDERRTEVVDR